MLPVETPFKTYTGLNGLPLHNGYVYFGQPGQNPVTAPVTVYWDAAGTQPAAQPLRTVNGYIMRAGTPANVFLNGSYSELVKDSAGGQVFYARTSDEFSATSTLRTDLAASTGASMVGFLPGGASALPSTVETVLRETRSVLNWIPDGFATATTDCHVYVQNAINDCLTNGWDLEVPVLVKLTAAVMIDRLVDSTTDMFTIFGNGTTAGFWTDQAITLFSSNLTPIFVGTPPSEFIRFKDIRFSSSVNTLNNFVLEGIKFLRMTFDGCYFYRIRLAYTNLFFQSWYLKGNTVQGIKGKFMQVVTGGAGTVSGSAFDMHFTDNVFELSDVADSQMLIVAQTLTGGDMKGNLFESWSGPMLKVGASSGFHVAGNYSEGFSVNPVFDLGASLSITFVGNFFDTAGTAGYYPIDCGTSWTVISMGNWSNRSLYKVDLMPDNTVALTAAGFYDATAQGLVSIGDISYNNKVSNNPNQATRFRRLVGNKVFAGIRDFSVGNVVQQVGGWYADGVSGVLSPSGCNIYTTPGSRAAAKISFKMFDDGIGDAAPSLEIQENSVLLVAARTGSSALGANSGVATTLFTLPGLGRYEVFAYLADADAAQYAAVATVIYTGASNPRIIANNAALLTLTLSGLNVQATQGSGVIQNIAYKYLKIA